VWFLPIYLGPTLAMLLAWMVLRKMIRIARTYRITSIADFIASRYGKSRAAGRLVTLITLVGIVPYVALQLKAIASGYALLTAEPGMPARGPALVARQHAVLRAGAGRLHHGLRHAPPRHHRAPRRHGGGHRARVGGQAGWPSCRGRIRHLGPVRRPGRHLRPRRVARRPAAAAGPGRRQRFAYEQWFALTLLAMLSVLFLPRQFQVMVVENVDERHVRRASWAFPLYLLLINLFVLPVALGGLLHFGAGGADPETFVLSLPLSQGWHALALAAFIGGLSAATGMVVVEAIAVSTMVCNDLVMPLLLRSRRFATTRAT
jgi:hypothetical protein